MMWMQHSKYFYEHQIDSSCCWLSQSYWWQHEYDIEWYSHYGFPFTRTRHMISFVSLVMVMTNDDADVVVDDYDDDDDCSYHLKHTMVTTSVHRCLLVRGIFWAHSCFLRWVSIASQKTTNIQNVTIFVETILILLLLPPLPPPCFMRSGLLKVWEYQDSPPAINPMRTGLFEHI